MIFWEAAFIVVAGELAGIICGFFLSYILIYVINQQSFGWTFLYSVDWMALGMSVPLIRQKDRLTGRTVNIKNNPLNQ